MVTKKVIDAVTPEWVRNSVFYQILPDRFARSSKLDKTHFEPWDSKPNTHGFKGGDLYGVSEQIPYLKELGINAIYLNPIFAAGSNHRYNTFDYYKVDPILGGEAALRELLDNAHQNNIKVILDGVFNHVGRGFYQFNHVLECGKDSPYKDWFKINKFPLNAYSDSKKPNYWSWWNIKSLPKLNTDNKEVRAFILDVAKYWIAFGADGWRLDVPNEINDDKFWQEFRRVIKAQNKDAYIVGEIWKDEDKFHAKRWLKGDQFDAIMNYGFKIACDGFFIGSGVDKKMVNDGEGQAKVIPLSATKFAKRIETMQNRYPKEIVYSMYNLLDSHDTARFLTLAHKDIRALKLAVLMMMTYIGAPSIFYGDEIGIFGGKEPDSRKTFDWDRNNWDMDLFNHYQKLITIRKENPCLRLGSYKTILADDKKNMYAFSREYNSESILVIINNSNKPQDIPLDIERNAQCLLSGKPVDKIIDAKSGLIIKQRLSA